MFVSLLYTIIIAVVQYLVHVFGQVIDGGFSSVRSMALDWITKNIYWTDFRLHRIEVASADGRFRAPLITENITEPSSIVLDPRPGYVCASYTLRVCRNLASVIRVSQTGICGANVSADPSSLLDAIFPNCVNIRYFCSFLEVSVLQRGRGFFEP